MTLHIHSKVKVTGEVFGVDCVWNWIKNKWFSFESDRINVVTENKIFVNNHWSNIGIIMTPGANGLFSWSRIQKYRQIYVGLSLRCLFFILISKVGNTEIRNNQNQQISNVSQIITDFYIFVYFQSCARFRSRNLSFCLWEIVLGVSWSCLVEVF